MQVLCQKTTKGAGISQTAIHTPAEDEPMYCMQPLQKLRVRLGTCKIDLSLVVPRLLFLCVVCTLCMFSYFSYM